VRQQDHTLRRADHPCRTSPAMVQASTRFRGGPAMFNRVRLNYVVQIAIYLMAIAIIFYR